MILILCTAGSPERTVTRRFPTSPRIFHIDVSADTNVETEVGVTPLPAAGAANGDVIATQWLLEVAANPNLFDSTVTDVVEFAATAMHYDDSEGAKIIELILRADTVNVNMPNKAGVTLLQLALSIGSYSLLNVVLAAGADVSFLPDKPNAPTNYGPAQQQIRNYEDQVEIMQVRHVSFLI